MVRKRVQFDNDTWEAIEAVIHDIGKTFQALASQPLAS